MIRSMKPRKGDTLIECKETLSEAVAAEAEYARLLVRKRLHGYGIYVGPH